MESIDRAFRRVQRKNFLPEEVVDQADIDAPLPIGFGQTNSQPYTVRKMLQWLDAKPGDTVLDVGSGSGWTTALLSELVGPKGKVLGVEIVPQLVESGRQNCRRSGTKNVSFYQAGDKFGLEEHSPYDRILVSASADALPKVLLDQLKVGGKLVIPVRGDILEITKTSEDDATTEVHPGFMFVPLV